MSLQRKRVAFVGQPEYFRFCYENDLNEVYEVREYPLITNGVLNDFSEIFHFNPDVILIFRADFLPFDFFERLDCIKIAISSEPFPRYIDGWLEYSFDSVLRYLFFRKNIRFKNIDYLFHYDEASLEYMRKDGLMLSGAFHFPVATQVYFPRPDEKSWDIFFIGRDTRHREKFFLPLKKDFNFLHIAHGIYGEGLMQYISQSSICVNVHAEDEVSWEPRMQMLLAAGAFVISEKITPNDVLRPGIDYVEASSPADMYQKIDFYLQHPDLMKKISDSGRARILMKLQSSKIFPGLIEDVINGKYKKFHAHSGGIWLNFFDCLLRARESLKRNSRLIISRIRIRI